MFLVFPKVSEKFANLLFARARPDLYRENGYRRLGLCVPADTRGMMRRYEELRVAVELGQSVGGWAFAPVEAASSEELRAATRTLQEPMHRLLDEFFWFWPLAYPDGGDDPALAAFMAGDTTEATQIWSEAAGRGEPAAWHNLAVYQHLLALEWLEAPDADPEVLRSLWRDAVAYWRHVVSDEALWQRLRARIEVLGDPQLPVSAAAQVRAGLSAVLGRINAQVALRHGAKGEVGQARFQIDQMKLWLSVGEVRVLLEESARPVARRVGAQIKQARRTGANGLADAQTLLGAVRSDLDLLQILDEPAAEVVAELLPTLAEALLEQLAAAGKGGLPPAAGLPLLLVVLDLVASGPLLARAEDAFSLALADALAVGAGEPEDEEQRTFALITGKIRPELDALPLTATIRDAANARLAGWLQSLAETAMQTSPALLPWALHVMDAAAGLPLDTASRAALGLTIRNWARVPRVEQHPAVELAADGHSLRIDAAGITWNELRIDASELTGLRHPLPGFSAETPPVVAWSTVTEAWELPPELLSGEATVRTVLAAVHHFLAPNLFARIHDAIRGGATVPLGPLQLTASGIFTSDSSELRSYATLRLATPSGEATLTDDADPDFALTLDPSFEWNVPLLPLLLLVLTQR